MHKKMSHRAAALIAIALSIVLSTGTPNFAQGVADAARQERERRRQLALHAAHVYTNEDLSKERILVPADEAKVAARPKESPGTAVAKEGPSSPVVPMIPTTATVTVSETVSEEADRESGLPDALANMTDVSEPARDSSPVMLRRSLSTPLAPAISQQAQGSPAVLPQSLTRPPVAMEIPAADSRPLAKRAANSSQQPEGLVVSGIKIPATTMPFIGESAYASENIILPAAPSNSLAVNGRNYPVKPPPAQPEMILSLPAIPFVTAAARGAANVGIPVENPPSTARQVKTDGPMDIAAPAMPANVAASPRLTIIEHSIVRAEDADSYSRVVPCPGSCGAQASMNRVSSARATVSEMVKDAAGSVIKVEPGDSLWKLAERYLGNGLRWKWLAALNPQLANPSRILVGQLIHVPADRKQPAKQLVVQPGDTLWKVARVATAGPLSLSCIAQANPQLRSLDLIRAGETLNVPSVCGESSQN